MDIAAYVEALRRPEIVLGAVLAIASLTLWQVPVIGWPLYPFYLFGVFVHELCHALATLLTGGKVWRVDVFYNRSGVAFSQGGIWLIIASAGYVGSAFFGSLLLVIAASDWPADSVLLWLSLIFAVLCLLFVRNPFGIISGLGIAALFAAAALYVADIWTEALLWLLAIQLLLDAFTSLGELLDATEYAQARSDAHNMAKLTGIPPFVWVVIWFFIALSMFLIALSWAFNLPMPWELRLF
jgi:hypothetical protein